MTTYSIRHTKQLGAAEVIGGWCAKIPALNGKGFRCVRHARTMISGYSHGRQLAQDGR